MWDNLSSWLDRVNRLFAMTLTLIVINMYMSGQDET